MSDAEKGIPTVRVANLHDGVRLTERTALITVSGPTPGETGRIEIALEAAVRFVHALQQSIPVMVDLRAKAGLASSDFAVPASNLQGFDIVVGEDGKTARLLLRTQDRIRTQIVLSTADLRSIRAAITEALEPVERPKHLH